MRFRQTYRPRLNIVLKGTLAELTRDGTRHYMQHNFKNENLDDPSLTLANMLDILAHRKKLTVDEENNKIAKLKDETLNKNATLKENEAKISKKEAELKCKKAESEMKGRQLIEKQRKVRNLKAAVVRRQKALDVQELRADVRKKKLAEIQIMKPDILKQESEIRKLRAQLQKLQAQVPKLQAQIPKLKVVIQKLEAKLQKQEDVLDEYIREFDGYKITFEKAYKEFEDQLQKEAESSNAAAGKKKGFGTLNIIRD